MVERLKHQLEDHCVVSEAWEQVQNCIALVATDGDFLTIIRSRKALNEPVGNPYGMSSLDESRSGRGDKRDNKRKETKINLFRKTQLERNLGWYSIVTFELVYFEINWQQHIEW